MAIEEAAYTLVQRDGAFELREYAPQLLAETVVEGDLESAGTKAFTRLFRYISGHNRPGIKVAMTAPVSQEPARQTIRMTAPVGQEPVPGGWAVSFMMPATFTLETLPEPDDPAITLRQVPARRVAAVRYAGAWSEKGYLRHKTSLEAWIRTQGWAVTGAVVWARYNAPFMPWFLRRNEVLIPVS
jgi:hypothetical protein